MGTCFESDGGGPRFEWRSQMTSDSVKQNTGQAIVRRGKPVQRQQVKGAADGGSRVTVYVDPAHLSENKRDIEEEDRPLREDEDEDGVHGGRMKPLASFDVNRPSQGKLLQVAGLKQIRRSRDRGNSGSAPRLTFLKDCKENNGGLVPLGAGKTHIGGLVPLGAGKSHMGGLVPLGAGKSHMGGLVPLGAGKSHIGGLVPLGAGKSHIGGLVPLGAGKTHIKGMKPKISIPKAASHSGISRTVGKKRSRLKTGGAIEHEVEATDQQWQGEGMDLLLMVLDSGLVEAESNPPELSAQTQAIKPDEGRSHHSAEKVPESQSFSKMPACKGMILPSIPKSSQKLSEDKYEVFQPCEEDSEDTADDLIVSSSMEPRTLCRSLTPPAREDIDEDSNTHADSDSRACLLSARSTQSLSPKRKDITREEGTSGEEAKRWRNFTDEVKGEVTIEPQVESGLSLRSASEGRTTAFRIFRHDSQVNHSAKNLNAICLEVSNPHSSSEQVSHEPRLLISHDIRPSRIQPVVEVPQRKKRKSSGAFRGITQPVKVVTSVYSESAFRAFDNTERNCHRSPMEIQQIPCTEQPPPAADEVTVAMFSETYMSQQLPSGAIASEAEASAPLGKRRRRNLPLVASHFQDSISVQSMLSKSGETVFQSAVQVSASASTGGGFSKPGIERKVRRRRGPRKFQAGRPRKEDLAKSEGVNCSLNDKDEMLGPSAPYHSISSCLLHGADDVKNIRKRRGHKKAQESLKVKGSISMGGKFRRLSEPSGFLGDFNPGIIQRVRNPQQVHAVLGALVGVAPSKEVNSTSSSFKEVPGVSLEDTKCIPRAGTERNSNTDLIEVKPQLFWMAKQETLSRGRHHQDLERITRVRNASTGAEEGQREHALHQCNVPNEISQRSEGLLLDRRAREVESSQQGMNHVEAYDIFKFKPGHPDTVNEKNDRRARAFTNPPAPCSTAAAGFSAQWLGLLTLDIKGRLSALKRSRRRVRALLVSGELDNARATPSVGYFGAEGSRAAETSQVFSDAADYITWASAQARLESEADKWRAVFTNMDCCLLQEAAKLESHLWQVQQMEALCQDPMQFISGPVFPTVPEVLAGKENYPPQRWSFSTEALAREFALAAPAAQFSKLSKVNFSTESSLPEIYL